MKKLFRITFRPSFDEQEVTLYAEEVDMTIAPYIAIRHICLPVKSHIIHVENDDYNRFKDVKSVIIPYTSLLLLEELKEGLTGETVKLMPKGPNRSSSASSSDGGLI
jgi:hypothetical protein